MTGYVTTFKVEDKDNIMMSFHIYDEKQFEKYEAIWTKNEYLKDIKVNALPVYDIRPIKIKIKTYGDKVYTYFRGSNVQEDDKECESFTVNENKYYLQLYLNNCAYKQIISPDYLDGNLFKD